MVGFRGFRKRRFGRRKIGRRRLRRARKVIRSVKRRVRKKIARKQRAKRHLWAYAYAKHDEVGFGNVAHLNLAPATANAGLFHRGDVDELFQQVRQLEDLIYPNFATTGGTIKSNRQNLSIRVKGEALYRMTNSNLAGGAFVTIYVVRPRRPISANGIGSSSSRTAAEVIENNRNSAFFTDYNDASGLAINAAGTAGITNILQNATSQTRPTIGRDQIWFTPFMVPTFTQNYKVIRTLKYYIPPGGCIQFKLKTRWFRLDRQDMMLDGAALMLNELPTFGQEVVARVAGQPVNDDTTHTEVNLGRVTLNTVVTKKYWYSYSHKPMPSYVVGTNTLGTVVAASLPGEVEQAVEEASAPP